MNLTRYEQETHITFNAADDTAEVETHDPKYIRKLNRLCEELPDVYKKNPAKIPGYQGGESGCYIMPKRLVRFGKPVTREMSEEQKEAARQRFAKYREEKKDCDRNDIGEEEAKAEWEEWQSKSMEEKLNDVGMSMGDFF